MSSGLVGAPGGERSNWMRWGPDDRRGTLNLIDTDKVLGALSLAKHGILIDIGYPIADGEPVQSHKSGATFELLPRAATSGRRGSLDGEIRMRIHSGTHLDSLSHYWTGPQLFNGVSQEDVASGHDSSLSVSSTPPIVTRAVFVDVSPSFAPNANSWGAEISADDLSAAVERAGCGLRAGDALLIRTGWSLVWKSDPECYLWGEPGIGVEAAEWAAARDIALIGADNWAVEAVPPSVRDVGLPVHDALLRRYGILIMENLSLEDLNRLAGPGEYLLILTPLRITGAPGSPVRPVVIT